MPQLHQLASYLHDFVIAKLIACNMISLVLNAFDLCRWLHLAQGPHHERPIGDESSHDQQEHTMPKSFPISC